MGSGMRRSGRTAVQYVGRALRSARFPSVVVGFWAAYGAFACVHSRLGTDARAAWGLGLNSRERGCTRRRLRRAGPCSPVATRGQ